MYGKWRQTSQNNRDVRCLPDYETLSLGQISRFVVLCEIWVQLCCYFVLMS